MIYFFMISYLYICYCHDVKDNMTHNINDNGDHRRRRYNNYLLYAVIIIVMML